jgi:hypothetical protein
MPARDIYHNAVKNALVKEGWIITDEPLHLKWGQKDMYVDLGAKQLLAAEQGSKKIAVEIKSFVSPSEMADLKDAIDLSCIVLLSIGWNQKEHYIWQCATAYLQLCLKNQLVHF